MGDRYTVESTKPDAVLSIATSVVKDNDTGERREVVSRYVNNDTDATKREIGQRIADGHSRRIDDD